MHLSLQLFKDRKLIKICFANDALHQAHISPSHIVTSVQKRDQERTAGQIDLTTANGTRYNSDIFPESRVIKLKFTTS